MVRLVLTSAWSRSVCQRKGAVFDAAFGAEFGELLLVVLVGAASGLPVVDLVGDHLVVGK